MERRASFLKKKIQEKLQEGDNAFPRQAEVAETAPPLPRGDSSTQSSLHGGSGSPAGAGGASSGGAAPGASPFVAPDVGVMRQHVPEPSEPTRDQRERLRDLLQPADVSPMDLPTYLLEADVAPWEEGLLEDMEKARRGNQGIR